jgi:hypothetical protein
MKIPHRIYLGFLVAVLALPATAFADNPIYLRKNATPPAAEQDGMYEEAPAPKTIYVPQKPAATPDADVAMPSQGMYWAPPAANKYTPPPSYANNPAIPESFKSAAQSAGRIPRATGLNPSEWPTGLDHLKTPSCSQVQKKERDALERKFLIAKYQQVFNPKALSTFNKHPEGKKLRQLVLECGPNLMARDDKMIQGMTDEQKEKIVQYYMAKMAKNAQTLKNAPKYKKRK